MYFFNPLKTSYWNIEQMKNEWKKVSKKAIIVFEK